MGDRGNIAVAMDDGGIIYLYTHWGGSGIRHDLERALARRQRWNDAPYLTRIIFDEMTTGQHGNETGFGLSTYPPDNEHPILTVHCGQQKVYIDGGPAVSFEDWAKGLWPKEES
jgi:hypothetical protein